MKAPKLPSPSHPTGPAAIAAYTDVLALLTGGEKTQKHTKSSTDLLFIRNVRGVEALYQTISAVAAATSGANDEEWNPLSQRPHSPLPPKASTALGFEIYALKEAVDAFTTLAHEMMHVALWEPFFTGRWRPRSRQSFTEFSLLAEGYCFFFSDIIVSGAVRVRLPDGEYALDRQSTENVRFHPARAFRALGIENHEDILDIYLDGFRGRQTRLWQPRGTSAYASSLAAQVLDFYNGSLLPLHELHDAIKDFGGMTEFFKRFCAIPGLPTFLDDSKSNTPGGADLKNYFTEFFRSGLQSLDSLTTADIGTIRTRRALQMRAYYGLQVRWLISVNLIMAPALSAPRRRKLATAVSTYLNSIEILLKNLAGTSDSFTKELSQIDADYNDQIRMPLISCDVWVASRKMIAPRRAGGSISSIATEATKKDDARILLLRLSAYLIDELTRRMRSTKTVSERAEVMAQIERIASLGAAGNGTATEARRALRHLRTEVAKPQLRDAWSLPLACFNPLANQFRELTFSYQ